MARRLVLKGPLLKELEARDDLRVDVLTQDPRDAEHLAATSARHLSWSPLYPPQTQARPLAIRRRLKALAHRGLLAAAGGRAGFPNLAFRFNHLHGFRGHHHKATLPADRRRLESTMGNHVDPSLGEPCPSSRLLLRAASRVHYSSWRGGDGGVEEFFDRSPPQKLVLVHVQDQALLPHYLAAKRRGVPTLGIVQSWDQPTTKGPIYPGLDRILVLSEVMAEEVTRYHGVSPSRIEATGWPSLDLSLRPPTQPRHELLKRLGLEPDRTVILFAGNPERLGPHEPSVAAELSSAVASGRLGERAALVVRPHPLDEDWRRRFGSLDCTPRTVVLSRDEALGSLFDQLHLADVVVASQGSVAVDAVAVDACVVLLAYDGDLTLPPNLSIQRWYEMDHFLPVIESSGVTLAHDARELELAVNAYLKDPSRHADGRRRLRDGLLAPLDGLASRRMVEAIADLTEA